MMHNRFIPNDINLSQIVKGTRDNQTRIFRLYEFLPRMNLLQNFSIGFMMLTIRKDTTKKYYCNYLFYFIKKTGYD